MAFTAKIAPPTGMSPTTTVQGKTGQTYFFDTDGNITLYDEADFRALLSQGWSVVTCDQG